MANLMKAIPLRQIYLLLFALFAFTLLASYLYLLKKPWQSYTSLKRSRTFMESKVATGGNIDREIQGLQQEVARLQKELHGEGSSIPSQRLIAHNIDRLDRLASRHGVRLEMVKPDAAQTVRMFAEIPLTIRVSGSYFHLYAFLHEVEIELGPMVVKQFDLLPKMANKELVMNLKMVTYVPQEP